MVIDYIPYLRSMIGHKKCLSVGLSALVIDKNGRILLEKRKDNGLFCLPGGSIDLNETVIEGVKREVYEETGVVLEKVELFSIRSGEKNDFYYPNGDITQYVGLDFISYVDNPIIAPKDKESDFVFFCEVDKLPPLDSFLPGSRGVIEKYLRKDFSLVID